VKEFSRNKGEILCTEMRYTIPWKSYIIHTLILSVAPKCVNDVTLIKSYVTHIRF